MKGLYFASKKHEEFYNRMLRQSGRKDKYHCAFFYCVGITEITRDNVGKLFDFEDDSIKPEAIRAGWQTGESTEITCLAFNLWNGFMHDSREEMLCPYELFNSRFAPYYMESVKLRHPEQFRTELKRGQEKVWYRKCCCQYGRGRRQK